ncbi:MAG: DUF1127 domain-containing protein [Pseudomonadota bacterium]
MSSPIMTIMAGRFQTADWLSRQFDGLKTHIDRRIARRRVHNQTVRELSVLNDRELNDIGISRFDIVRLAAMHADMTVPSHSDTH